MLTARATAQQSTKSSSVAGALCQYDTGIELCEIGSNFILQQANETPANEADR